MNITIDKTWAVNNTPINVTSWTLAIVRNDTGGIVVAGGTPMVKTGTGTYTYTFAAPTPGLQYTATYTIVYDGRTYTLIDAISGSTQEFIAMPALTGDPMIDTYNSLLVERLRLSRNGPHVHYSVHDHTYFWGEMLDSLDRRIEVLRKEIAQSYPVEEIGFGV
jgi:hypothetical protein